MDELSSWTEYARVSSATLLQTLFVYHEDHVTEKLSKIVIALCKALKRGRNEKYGGEHRQSVLECARVLEGTWYLIVLCRSWRLACLVTWKSSREASMRTNGRT